METDDLTAALRRMSVETGSLVCLGCRHEHGCSVHGCAVLKEAADRIERSYRGARTHCKPVIAVAPDGSWTRIERLAHTEAKWPGTEDTLEALDMALSALRPVSREQVEKVWRGEWIVGEPNGLGFPIHCSRCGWGTDHADPRKWMDYGGHIFCGHCGAPMTDEAVEITMKRLEALKDG